MRPRPLATILPVVVLVSGALAGCGGDPPAVAPAHTAIARTHAQTVAGDIAIRAGDLPEYKAKLKARTPLTGARIADDPRCARVPRRAKSRSRTAGARGGGDAARRRQAGQSGSRVLRVPSPWAFAQSQRLSAGGGYHALGAVSSVSVMPTAAAARLSVRAGANADRACLKGAIRRAAAAQLPVRAVVVGPAPVPAAIPGASVTAAYRTIVGVHGVPLVLYLDSTAFAYGQDVIELTTYHTSRPVPPGMDERLLGLLAARARAHSG